MEVVGEDSPIVISPYKRSRFMGYVSPRNEYLHTLIVHIRFSYNALNRQRVLP